MILRHREKAFDSNANLLGIYRPSKDRQEQAPNGAAHFPQADFPVPIRPVPIWITSGLPTIRTLSISASIATDKAWTVPPRSFVLWWRQRPLTALCGTCHGEQEKIGISTAAAPCGA